MDLVGVSGSIDWLFCIECVALSTKRWSQWWSRWNGKIGNVQKLLKSEKQSFVGAIAVADLVKTTLGPKGMDKILKPTGSGPM